MVDESEGPGEHSPQWWRTASDHPEVERVDIVGSVVRVRLRSGIELEWVPGVETPGIGG